MTAKQKEKVCLALLGGASNADWVHFTAAGNVAGQTGAKKIALASIQVSELTQTHKNGVGWSAGGELGKIFARHGWKAHWHGKQGYVLLTPLSEADKQGAAEPPGWPTSMTETDTPTPHAADCDCETCDPPQPGLYEVGAPVRLRREKVDDYGGGVLGPDDFDCGVVVKLIGKLKAWVGFGGDAVRIKVKTADLLPFEAPA